MNWINFKSVAKKEIQSTHNKGLDTETLIFKNGFGISKYELKEKHKITLQRLNIKPVIQTELKFK